MLAISYCFGYATSVYTGPIYITARSIDSVYQYHSGEIGLRALGIVHMAYASAYL